MKVYLSFNWVMRIEDIPDSKGAKYPEKLTLCLSHETYQKIQKLKEMKKDPHTFIRQKIEEIFRELAV